MIESSESSPPTKAVQLFRSSPPVIASESVPNSMEADFEGDKPGAEDGIQLSRASSTDTECPPSARRPRETQGQYYVQDGKEKETEASDSDPAEELQKFNWDDLAERYHQEIRKCETDEAQLRVEWEHLMNFFRIWSEAGHAQETDRTFSRFRTRTTHVQHSEDRLEETRVHYVNVVHAFESALSLLGSKIG